jgi:hypothetical protein
VNEPKAVPEVSTFQTAPEALPREKVFFQGKEFIPDVIPKQDSEDWLFFKSQIVSGLSHFAMKKANKSSAEGSASVEEFKKHLEEEYRNLVLGLIRTASAFGFKL